MCLSVSDSYLLPTTELLPNVGILLSMPDLGMDKLGGACLGAPRDFLNKESPLFVATKITCLKVSFNAVYSVLIIIR